MLPNRLKTVTNRKYTYVSQICDEGGDQSTFILIVIIIIDSRTGQVHLSRLQSPFIGVHTSSIVPNADVGRSSSHISVTRLLVLAYVLCWVSYNTKPYTRYKFHTILDIAYSERQIGLTCDMCIIVLSKKSVPNFLFLNLLLMYRILLGVTQSVFLQQRGETDWSFRDDDL